MQTRPPICAFGGSKALEPHFDASTFNISWLASATFWNVGKHTFYLNFAASTVVFKTEVLHLVRSHEITKDAETESLSAPLSHVWETEKHTDPCDI